MNHSPHDYVELPEGIFLIDGGTGEELFRLGVPDDRKIWSATAVVKEEYHDTLKMVHSNFLDAGAQAITTNSYGVVPGVGFEHDQIENYCSIAGRIARESVRERKDAALVLGSLGPLIESYRADKILPLEEGVPYYKAMVKALDPYVDAFLIETMSCLEEIRQALGAIHELAPSKSVLISYTLDSDGRLRDGSSVVDGLRRTVQEAIGKRKLRLLAILFNCAEPEAITKSLKCIESDTELVSELRGLSVRLGAYANRLTPVAPDWGMEESDGPQPFRDLSPGQYCTDFCSRWIDELGVSIIGGCCGITPEHIGILHDKFNADQRNQASARTKSDPDMNND